MASPESAQPVFTPDELATVEAGKVPAHVAIIMDGNGRWAKNRGLPRVAGHRAGAKAVREAILAAQGLGVRYLTIFSFSSENWRRPKEEVSGLMELFVEVLRAELDNLKARDVRVRLIGRRDQIPSQTLAAFEEAERATADNRSLDLVVALNYGGRAEIVDAARALAESAAAGELDPGSIDEQAFRSHLYAPDLPDPDLLVRTSGEMRISNFLLWQSAYTEIWVTETLWPDFDRHEFLRAVADFQRRERRFGGTQ